MSKLTDIDRLFNGRHFDREVIVLCVRWYCVTNSAFETSLK
jgi:transposase-like protein